MKKRKVKRILTRMMNNQKLVFVFSFFLGATIAVIFHFYQNNFKENNFIQSDIPLRPYDFAYERWLQKQGFYSQNVDPDLLRYNSSHKDENLLNPMSEAFYLRQKIHVSCLVFPETNESALAVKETWGRHCNKLYQISHEFGNKSIPVDKIEGISNAFHLLCESFRRISKEEDDAFQWLLVTNANTFALVENLRHFLAPLNHSDTHYLGHAMQFWGKVYNWRNAGYVISKGTLDKLMAKFTSSEQCKKGGKYWKTEDKHLAEHLKKMDIVPVDTRDNWGRGRFNGFTFKKLLFPGAVSSFDRYWRDSLYLSEDGPHCCSNRAVTFNGITSVSKMYQLEYFFLHLRPFYGGGKHGNFPPKIHSPKETYLTNEEKLKVEGFAAFASKFLMTTPKMFHKLMKEQA